ncbi:hypothetical protein, partial [Shigella boydii]
VYDQAIMSKDPLCWQAFYSSMYLQSASSRHDGTVILYNEFSDCFGHVRDDPDNFHIQAAVISAQVLH